MKRAILKPLKGFLHATVLMALLGVPCLGAAAESYPTRPVKIILGLAPGGMNDIVARLLSDGLAKELGQPVVVENRVGAGGTIGGGYAANAAPDGYTLFLGAISNMAIAPSQYKNMPYDPIKDFAPITKLASSANILVAHPASEFKTVQEVIDAARKDPQSAMYATAGMGTSPHMAGELFNIMAKVKLPSVPYKGDGPALTDVAGGQVKLAFPALPAAMNMIRAGQLRPIAVTSKQRSSKLPDVPTISESGVAGYDMSPWVGMFAPAQTPKPIIQRLNQAFATVLKSERVGQRFSELALEPVGDSPEEFGTFLAEEIEKWSKVAKAAGIQPQ